MLQLKRFSIYCLLIKDVKRIDFKGGEPMLAKHHDDFQWMIDLGMTDVHPYILQMAQYRIGVS